MSLVRPLIEYASSAWDNHTEQLIAEVEKIQRRAARFFLSDYKHYEPGSMSMMLKKKLTGHLYGHTNSRQQRLK